ncbi:MAG: metal-dependent transcriptional regulator [Cryomorphaceae bacterium]|nr:metal-dependent transcriptional regulator [Cryomorphaceae bacterium]
MNRATKSEEDYLKMLLRFKMTGDDIGTNHLAAKLGVAPPSVTSMLKKLKSKGLVNYKKYGRISLTQLGERIAISLLRRHRIWEVFLYKTLGFTWTEVHEIAEQLEHVRSEKLINNLEAFLEFPKVDPHGDPIPTIELLMPNYEGHSLEEARTGQHCSLISVTDDSREILGQLDVLGLSIGSEFDVLGPGAPEGSFVILKAGNVSLIREELARKIYVI